LANLVLNREGIIVVQLPPTALDGNASDRVFSDHTFRDAPVEVALARKQQRVEHLQLSLGSEQANADYDVYQAVWGGTRALVDPNGFGRLIHGHGVALTPVAWKAMRGIVVQL
jgi:hypothetical protein